MQIEPKSLGVPLHKKNWSPLVSKIYCFGFAVLVVKPSRISQWLAALLVLAPAFFWITNNRQSFILRWQNHSDPFVRGAVFLVRLVCLLAVIRHVVPWLIVLLDRIIQK